MAERNASNEGTRGKPEATERVPLASVVDLARHPERSLLALWYVQQIAAGAVVVHSLFRSPWGEELQTRDFRSLWGEELQAGNWSWEWAQRLSGCEGKRDPVPQADLSSFFIDWPRGEAVVWEADHCTWEADHFAWFPVRLELSFARADLRSHPPAGEMQALASEPLWLTFGGACYLVQRWRELAALPSGWWMPEEEFWQAHPEARPDWQDTRACLLEAVRKGGLRSFRRLPAGDWEEVPASTWLAGSERIELTEGRVNVGATKSERASAESRILMERMLRRPEEDVAAYIARARQQMEHDRLSGEEIQLPPELGERWVLALLRFAEVRRWFEETFSPRSAEPAAGPADGEHPMPETAVETGAKPKPKGRPIKDFWPRVLGWAAGWLAVNGKPTTPAADVERVIAQRIGELQGEAGDTQVSTYARELLDGFREQVGR